MKKYKILFFLFWCLLATPCFAADYYCDLTLSNDGLGTVGDPWQWSQAISSENVNPGDTVYLRGIRSGVTFNTDTDANGISGNQIIYSQWGGENQAQFTSILISGVSAPYYKFSGINFDSGTGTEWITAISEDLSGGGGELTFDGCTVLGFRSSSFSDGDFYPYFLAESDMAQLYSGTFYSMSFTSVSDLILTVKNCTFQYGHRIVNLYGLSNAEVFFENNTFNDCGEDFISIGDSDGLTFHENTFATNYAADYRKDVLSWPSSGYIGIATGTWSGHEGETITQDTTGASGIYVGQYNGRLYLVADDSMAVPNRSINDIWRLDSDPNNIYWTSPHYGDSMHNDHIQLIGDVDDIIIDANYFQGRNPVAFGYGIKFDGTNESVTIDNAVFSNNIMDFNAAGGVYCILAEYANNALIANNIIINSASTVGSFRYLDGGTYIVANNIMTGALDSYLTGVTAHNNIFNYTDPWSGSNSLSDQDFSDSPIGNNRYFTNFTTGNYTPYNQDSPQINAGYSFSSNFSIDILGISRPQSLAWDVGAYEYVDVTIPNSPTNLTVL